MTEGLHPPLRAAARRASRGHALAGALAVAALLSPAAGRAACGIQVLELPVRMVGVRAIADVGINGTQVPLAVDSGAFFSFLSDAAAAQLGLTLRPLPGGMRVAGLAGSVEARQTTVDRLELLKGQIPKVQFVVGGNEPGAGAMGLLGRNILEFADTEYDLAHGVIRFVAPGDGCEKSDMAYWAGDAPHLELALLREFRERLPAIRAVVEVNGHKVTALFDTGAPSTLLSLDAAHRAGVKDDVMTPDRQKAGAGLGKVDSWLAPVDKVDFGGEAILHNQLEVADYDLREAGMLVGIDFFLSHHIYVSQAQRKMFFTYNGGPVFARNLGDRSAAVRPDAAASGATDAAQADALARRGAASLARGDIAGALADLDRACVLDPSSASHFASRAEVHMARKDFAQATADLDTALRLSPALPMARIRRAWLREQAHQRDAALEDLAALDKALPPQSDYRHGMALLYAQMNLPAQSLAQWDLWIPVHPHDISLEGAYNSRCWLRASLGTDLDKALQDCDAALDSSPKNASYLDSRGWVRLRMGKLSRARADFDRGLAIDPHGAWSLYGRGLVHLGLGEAPQGYADLAAARATLPDIDAQVARAGLPIGPAAPAPVAAAAAAASSSSSPSSSSSSSPSPSP